MVRTRAMRAATAAPADEKIGKIGDGRCRRRITVPPSDDTWPPRYGQHVQPLPSVFRVNTLIFLCGAIVAADLAACCWSRPDRTNPAPVVASLFVLQWFFANANQALMISPYNRFWRYCDFGGAIILGAIICTMIDACKTWTVWKCFNVAGVTLWLNARQMRAPTRSSFEVCVNTWHAWIGVILAHLHLSCACRCPA